MAIIGHAFYRAVVRYMDYQASWLQNPEITRLTSNRGIAYWDVNMAASSLQSYEKNGPWVSTE